jgi:hypothetical protein
MLKSLTKSMWIIGCLSLFAFAGLSGGLRLMKVENEDLQIESAVSSMGGDAGQYLELEPVRRYLFQKINKIMLRHVCCMILVAYDSKSRLQFSDLHCGNRGWLLIEHEQNFPKRLWRAPSSSNPAWAGLQRCGLAHLGTRKIAS